MADRNTLRRSRTLFSERHNVPGDVNYYQWLEGQLGIQVVENRDLVNRTVSAGASNCPNLATHLRNFSRSAPWQLHSVVRNIFAGRTPALLADAAAHDAVGRPPFAIAISDGMYIAADQCVYMWESLTRILVNSLNDYQRGLSREEVGARIDEAFNARGIQDRTYSILEHLLRALRIGEPGLSPQQHSEEFRLPVIGIPAKDLGRRSRLQYCWEQFVIAHELSHVILGHLGSPGSRAASLYAGEAVNSYRSLANWKMLDSDSQRSEAGADLFGLFELCYPVSWALSKRRGIRADWNDRSRISLLAQHLEGVAVATFSFYLLSALGVPIVHSSSHPHPDTRIALAAEATMAEMRAIIAETSEPDEGPDGFGFYERAVFTVEQTPFVYRSITRLFDVALNNL